MKTVDHTLKPFTTLACVIALFACGLNRTAQAGGEAAKIAPPNARPYGQSSAEWLKQYSAWFFLEAQAPEVFGHVLFPVVEGSTTGSGTLADPLVSTGHGNFTVKAGTALWTPLLFWAAEIYEDRSVDPEPPETWWGTYLTLAEDVVLDGETVLTGDEIGNYYIAPHYFDPPLEYPEPTWYGSVGVTSVQGWGIMCRPLPVGVHELSWAAAVMIPADNDQLPGFEIGQLLQLSYTIAVVP